MTPVERLRIEKAASDCGFEMTPLEHSEGLELRSARFPETVLVQVVGDKSFRITASDPFILDAHANSQTLTVGSFSDLYNTLKAAAAYARTRPNRVADEFKKKTATLPKSTEAERLVVQRIGQDLFRSALLDYWQGRCSVTGLDMPALLRASHIRPWAKCDTDEQRLDVFNGLLLAPHLDALFDLGLMTVEDDGAVRLSKEVKPEQQKSLGLSGTMMVKDLRKGHCEYLAFHRSVVWRG